METTSWTSRKTLEQNLETEVLIIGGGMAGILTAHKLKEKGIQSVIVEANQIGHGVTGNTTAKITAQHGLIYANLIRKFGKKDARSYYDANRLAIDDYQRLSEQFPCDFETTTAYTYLLEDKNALAREAKAYAGLGINSKFEDHSSLLPFPIAGMLAMENQGQFHPLKLLYGLAEGLNIYERTFVEKIEDNIAYTKDHQIKAKHIVLATHYPLVNIPGLYVAKLYQHRSYVMAIKNAPLMDGMLIDGSTEGYSFRTYGDYLLVGGGAHRTGEKGGGYDTLERFIRETYPEAEIKYRWATQDCMSLDNVPYIGYHRELVEGRYVITGFNKWGMTGSMVSANVITDLITEGHSPWERIFEPSRTMRGGKLPSHLATVTKNLLSLGGPRCSHMGCKLHWNPVDNSWDCPCHGSRYDEAGQIINNPAKKNINPPKKR